MSLDSRACIEYSLIETIVGQKHWKTKNRLILQCSCNYCQIFGVWARLAGRKKRPRKRARAISLSFPPKNELQWPDTYFSMRFAALRCSHSSRCEMRIIQGAWIFQMKCRKFFLQCSITKCCWLSCRAKNLWTREEVSSTSLIMQKEMYKTKSLEGRTL